MEKVEVLEKMDQVEVLKSEKKVEEAATVRRAKNSEVFLYSLGGVGSNVCFTFLMSYQMFFYTDIFGISAASVGFLFMIARVVDAVIDPAIGLISDSTRTKLGRYRPWIIFGAPIMAINFILMFWTPNIALSSKVIYAFTTYIIYTVTSSFVNIPYHALTAEMSEDSVQRTDIATAKQTMAIPANLLVSAAALPVIGLLGGGQSGWFMFAIIIATITVLSFWACARGAKYHDVITDKMLHADKHDEKIPFTTQLKVVVQNKPLLILMSSSLVQMTATTIGSAMMIYFVTYNLGNPGLIPIIALAGTLCALPVAFMIPVLSRKIDKKKLYMLGNLACATASALIYFVPTSNTMLIVIFMVLYSGLGQVAGILSWSMLPDCVDYAEDKLGTRNAGLVSSSMPLTNQFGMAFGGLIGGIVLSKIGYIAGAEMQTPAVLAGLLVVMSLVPVFARLLSNLIMRFYPITNEVHDEIIASLKAKERA